MIDDDGRADQIGQRQDAAGARQDAAGARIGRAEVETVSLREHLDDQIAVVKDDVAEIKQDVHEIRSAVAGVVTWRGLGAVVTIAATILGVVWMVSGGN